MTELRRQFPTIPADHTYFEPFLGGGAVFLHLGPQKAVLSDLNPPLMESYVAIRDNLPMLTRHLANLPSPAEERDYYERRSRFNRLLTNRRDLSVSDRVELAALFIWLNHTCFNGLYRVNRAGHFNAAFGDQPNPTIYSEVNLRAVRRALRNCDAELRCEDYEHAVRNAGRGDIVYLDPPYRSTHPSGGFSRYTAEGFDDQEQERLSRVVHELVDRGCHVVLSSAHNQRIASLYQDLKQRIVLAPRKINCDGAGRGRVSELLVTS